jgi:DNA-binding transcriptional LysR family regulator
MDNAIEIRQLRAFQTLARTGSFTQTAKELFLTQSAISHSIRALEESLECTLFDRVGKKVHINQAGEVLLEHAGAIFGAMRSAREAVMELSAWGKGRLRVGASTTTIQYVLPSVIREFRECFPDCELIIEPGDSPESLAALSENRIDLALTLPPEEGGPHAFQPLFEDELVLVYAPMHRWKQRGRVERDELAREPFITYNKRSATFRMIQAHLKRAGVELRNTMELGSVDAIRDLVKIGMGVSMLARWVVADDLANGVLCTSALGRRKLRRQWGIASIEGKHRNLMAETFCGLCESTCRQF